MMLVAGSFPEAVELVRIFFEEVGGSEVTAPTIPRLTLYLHGKHTL